MTRWLCLMLLLWASWAQAELTIEITRGQDNPTRVAVVPFLEPSTGVLPVDVSAVVGADLHRSGLFSLLPNGDMWSLPHDNADVYYRDWRALDVEYLLIGKLWRTGNGEVAVQYALHDVYRQQALFTEKARYPDTALRDMAHAISDRVYEALTGVPGAFATRILYVSARNLPGQRYNYRLMMADADGARSQQILESDEPILSPAWSPNGREIAFVSFAEGRKPAIYRYVLDTGQQEKLTDFPGLNSAPAWSPDGTQLAMVLSKDGSPDIYVMDMLTRRLDRITTNNISIDTEPAWMPDGESLVFTSNRGGNPQIYQVDLEERWIERLTFDGSYNARAVPLPDGSGIALVHRRDGNFRVAVMEFATGRLRVLSHTRLASLDESPTIAPNGSMLMYATDRGGRGILSAVSVDGNVSFDLPAKSRDVREPAWSPFLTTSKTPKGEPRSKHDDGNQLDQ